MKNKWKIIKCCIFVVLFWCCIWGLDYMRVLGENEPIFCVEMDKNHYVGVGYSFETYKHPVTEKVEFVAYILGIMVDNNFTN